jgi:hypothetical protein
VLKRGGMAGSRAAAPFAGRRTGGEEVVKDGGAGGVLREVGQNAVCERLPDTLSLSGVW